MIDHHRAGKRSKRRGDRGEREVVELLKEHGYLSAHRNFQSGGQGGADVADAIPDVHIEVKYTERLDLPGAWRQAKAAARPTDAIAVVHRANMQPWLATFDLLDLNTRTENRVPIFQVVGRRTPVRAAFLGLLRSCPQSSQAPVLIHQLEDGDAVVTTLADDWLRGLVVPG